MFSFSSSLVSWRSLILLFFSWMVFVCFSCSFFSYLLSFSSFLFVCLSCAFWVRVCCDLSLFISLVSSAFFFLSSVFWQVWALFFFSCSSRSCCSLLIFPLCSVILLFQFVFFPLALRCHYVFFPIVQFFVVARFLRITPCFFSGLPVPSSSESLVCCWGFSCWVGFSVSLSGSRRASSSAFAMVLSLTPW